MTPVTLRQSGEYDADFEAAVDADGRFRVEGGSYITRGRREGRLSARRQAEVERLAADAVRSATDRGAPPAGSFRSTLRVGSREAQWAGPPPTPEVEALVWALITL